ncbi:sensor histidine kinase [Empedobacter tilapiae]|uniref:GHKL domain-containing protein n=1 Tax=Empedobacter tilapiae TaxID=2491114 RepID=A0A4Z1B1X1_9FLAO|nr:ATP-binding protein [Empedobacter tilapiae]TGN24376.1 GHKL domain-containing protein [Empedobacter tilapiae]
MTNSTEKIPFKISARAGKLLGRENFSNPEGAITELVKNSYDADAENCFVFFDIPIIEKEDENKEIYLVPDKENSIIYIIDNGDGMERDIVEEYWMQIGTGNKEQFYLSDKERVKTGAKGIGRFALDRLGFETEMWTLSKKNKNNDGIYWNMDWAQFDDFNKSISEIEADITPVKIDIKNKINEVLGTSFDFSEIKDIDFEHGTILKICNLKDEWFPAEINSVFSSLEALIPPKELNIPFKVYFKHLQNLSQYGDVKTAFFNDFDYKVTAKYFAEKLSVEFTIERNELDLQVLKRKYGHLFQNLSQPFNLESIEKKTFTYTKSIAKLLNWEMNQLRREFLIELGDFQFTYNYIKFTNSKKEGYPYKSIVSRERRATLERFGGIKIYRDSFRVRPYGDPKNDWLGLGFRAGKSPAGAGQRIGDWRVNNESLAGIITISRNDNPLLVDKSDRGGLQENDAFELFKNIIIACIHEFEVDRSRVLNPIYIFNKQEEEKRKNEEIQKKAHELALRIIEDSKSNNTSNEEEQQEAYEEFFKESVRGIIDDKKEEENQEIVQVRSLASLGLIVSSFSHELKEVSNNASEIVELEKNVLNLIPNEMKLLPSSINDSTEFGDVVDIFALLKEDKEKIKHWIDYTLTAIRKDKRTRTKLNFGNFFIQLQDTWKRIFKRKDINFIISDRTIDTNYSFRAFEMDMTTIFSNLINNSIDSFEDKNSVDERNILIELSIVNNRIEIIFSDNGKGLDKTFDNKEEIFLAFTTSKRDRVGNEVGTGLGMYLVKSVIDDNNGNIEILEPEQGFAVKITFSIN